MLLMALDDPQARTDPAICAAMRRMIQEIETFDPRGDASDLAFRSAQMVGTLRRSLAGSKPGDFHRNLWLASQIEDFERRWSSSAEIGGHFDMFRRDSRRFVAMIKKQLPAVGKQSRWNPA
jgi:hypothetical protein